MKRFINSNIETYHHGAISDFSDTSKFLVSGSAKSHNTVEYSWIADMLFKNTGNLSLNPHVGYLSFVSDRDIVYQEFGNIEKIQTEYPFFSAYERSILSEINFELETKQYFKIGQRYSEFDLVEYINASEFITSPVDEYRVNHQFYRAPVFHATGYKLDLDAGDERESFDKYLWSKINDRTSYFNIEEYAFELSLYSGSSELPSGNSTLYYDYISIPGTPLRILDYKLNIDNTRYKYFDSGVKDWVYYYNETTHYQTSSYFPEVGFVNLYTGDSWEETFLYSNYYFFPEIVIDGVMEPAKIVTYWRNEESAPKGRMTYNTGNHLNDSKDQSRIVYNVCEDMLAYNGLGKYFVQREIESLTVFDGIDIDTERNRRYSAVVMTEPYFITTPMGSGQLVEYSFVDKDGNATSTSTDDKFLKIKTTLGMLSEIDRELNSNDVNTDIINVLTLRNPAAATGLWDGGDFYDKIRNHLDPTVFWNRQEACLDDLVGGIVGTGQHRTFYIDAFGADAAKYSNSKMKVCGAGVTWDAYMSSGVLTSRMDLNIYCTNYEVVDSPPPGTSETPQTNTYVEFLVSSSQISVYSGSEKFKPMIKLQGMNGYVKIMKKNTNFSVTRTSDGKYEAVYNIEFPYCPGSLNRRGEDLGVIEGFIYKKESYINAGSQEADSTYNLRHDAGNDRYAPYGDDSFGKLDILFNPGILGNYITTDDFKNGGGNLDTSTSKGSEKNKIYYPTSLVWLSQAENVSTLALTKTKFSDFRRYGTYEISFETETSPKDIKVLSLVDNRQWKFNDDKYVSYIGRENPCYVFEIDASVLSDDFSQYQAYYGSIPDTKRWLYGYFTGFSHVLLSQDLESLTPVVNTEKLSTMEGNADLLSVDSKSDITIEVWDQKSDLGNSQLGNWRPLMSLGTDNHKVPGSIVLDNIFITDISDIGGDDPALAFAGDGQDIYYVYISYMERNDSGVPIFIFPDSVDYGGSNDLLDGESNLILYDVEDKVSLHIAYIKRVNSPYDPESINAPQQIYKAYVKSDSGLSIFKSIDAGSIGSEETPQYQIRSPFKTLTKNPRFSSSTIRAVDGIDLGFLTKYLDVRGDADPYSDSERFLVDDKIYFRARVSRGKKYSSSYLSKDESEIPYVGEGVGDDSDAEREKLNFPWYDDGGNVENAFNWAKVKTEETIRKFGLNYFKCASK